MAEQGVWGADVYVSVHEAAYHEVLAEVTAAEDSTFPPILGEALQAPMKLLPARACKPFLPFFIWKPCLERSSDSSAVMGIANKSTLFPCSVLPCYFWSKLFPYCIGLSPYLLCVLPAAPKLAGLGGVTPIKSWAQWLQKWIVSRGSQSMISTWL